MAVDRDTSQPPCASGGTGPARWVRSGIGALALLTLGALFGGIVVEAQDHRTPDDREYRPGGDPRIPHPGYVPAPSRPPTHPPANLGWQQLLQAPRITGQFNTIEVDSRDASSIFIGTEEGTVVRSEDGGVTWREIEMLPFVIASRQVQVPTRPSLDGSSFEGIVTILQTPGALSLFEYPRLGLDCPLEYQIFPDDVVNSLGYIGSTGGSPSVNGPGCEGLGTYVDTFYVATDLLRRDAVLTRAVRGRKFETSPVRMIAVCPGNEFSVLAVTNDELYGSPDGGNAYVRLMRIPGNVKMNRVRCSRRNPERILVATNYGLFYSSDGGTTFDQELTARPGEPAYAANFGNVDETGKEIAVVGLDVRLFRGHPDRASGLEWAYPNFDNPETAPWMKINSVVTTPNGQIWLATDDGVRMSRDNGINWELVAPFLFNGHRIQQVLAGGNEWGGLRIAVFLEDCPEPPLRRSGVCRNSFVYATDDGGQTWFPYFVGVSRRRVVWMAAMPWKEGVPGKWWVATAGEVWSNVSGFDEQSKSPNIDREARAWAQQRLRKNPDLSAIKTLALDHYELSETAQRAMWQRARDQGYVPDVRVLFDAEFGREANLINQRILDPFQQEQRQDNLEWQVQVQARWLTWLLAVSLGGSFDPNDAGEDNDTRAELYELRRQVDFIVEDAWHERLMLLRRLEDGMTNAYQISVLQDRVELL
ncbi:MAG: hypothetical protein KC416_11340, partial [Myxococcales bacterium]|nr:hypothetical protein [Myxococcales bacterium]